jgi:S-adenosylmethionine:tRNA ribosyltransferase-isomerase
MKLSDFDYELPEELIAQTPIEPRDHSRMLGLDKETWEISEGKFYDILDELWENDVLVLNKTKVINARLLAYSTTVKWIVREVEVFLHKQLNDTAWDCLVYPGKRFKAWKSVDFKLEKNGPVIMTAVSKGNTEYWKILEFSKWWIEFMEIVEKLWEIPLPPYITEKLENSDRYQTVFNEISGSVAAPTAWLHFTPELIERLKNKWVKFEKVLLHVWLWTFRNVEVEDVTTHTMHSEYIEIDENTSKNLNQYKSEWKRIISVWTTSIRVLESFTDETGLISSWSMDTQIFIYPGYKWKFVDAMITNFHLPKSTLLMLISSFAGKENIEKSYKYAVDKEFRFFSFWDVMFIK